MMEGVTECQSFADFQSLRDTVEAVFGGPVSIVSSKSVEQANKDIRDGETKFPTCLQFKNVRLGCKQFGFRAEGKNTRATHSPVKIQCPAHVIAVANKDMGVLVIKQVCLEHNHPTVAFSTPERHRMPPALVEDDHPVSDVGLTITVSCKDQTSVVGNEGITAESNELKPGLLSDDDDGDDNEGEDSDDEEEEEEEEDDNNDSEDDDEEESDSPGSSSQQKKTLRKNSKARKYGKYSNEALAAAWSAISNDGLSVHMAAKIYKIPKSTLYDRVNNKNVFNLGCKPNANKSKILDPDTERQMVEHIRLLRAAGYHVTKNEMLSLASKLSRVTGRLGKKKKLSRGWLPSFMERWPDMWKDDKPQQCKGINLAFPHNAVAYYDKLKSIMSLRDEAFHKKPHLILNIDEIVFVSDRKSATSIPDVKKRSQVTSTDNVLASLLICGSAAGHLIPPYFVFKDKKPKESFIDGTAICLSNSGMVDSRMFKSFLEDHLLDNMCMGLVDHVLVLYDQRTNFIDKELIDWARDQKIILYPDPPHTRYSSQPLEFGCVLSFKTLFNSICTQYMKDPYHLDNNSFFQLAYTAMHKSVVARVLKDMFERAGIYPYDTSKLTKEHLLPYTYQSPAPEVAPKQPVRKRQRVIRTGPSESDDAKEAELCCACKKSEPPLNSGCDAETASIFWGQCSKCAHWVHLKYCSPVKSKIRITVGRYHKYAMEDMERAYKAIKERSMSVHTASQKFGIPKSTLYDRINDRSVYNLGGKPNRWKTRILDEETEHQMVDHIKHMESIGQALSQAEILSLATKLAQTAGTIPKSRSLSRGWYKAFICRWPDTKKGPENVHKPGGMIGVYRKPKSKQEYFVTVKSIMDKCRLHCKPHFVYKLDEIVFNLEKKASAMPQPQKRAQIFGDTDSMSTVLLCGNALGYSIPPYFAFKKRKNLNLSQGSSMDGSVFKSGDSGLVSAAAIRDFLLNHFIPHTVKKEDEQVLLLYEDHASVITHSLAEWAAEQGIILYTLPAIYSDPSRSLDFGCFYPFCQAFTSVGAGFLEEHRKKITAHDLAQLVYMAMIRSVTMKNLKASFLQAGIYPFDKARKELLLAKNLSDSGSSGKRKRSSAKKSGRKRVRVS